MSPQRIRRPNRRRPDRLVLLILLGGLTGLPGCVALRYGAPAVLQRPEQAVFVIDIPIPELEPTADHHGGSQPEPVIAAFPEAGWVHGFSVEVLSAMDDTLPSEILHHVKAMVLDRRELFHPIMLRVMGAGSETGAAKVPHTLGLPLNAGDSILVTAMTHNPTSATISGARIRLVLLYTPETPGRRSTDAYPFFLHVTPPDQHSGYDLPPGYSVRSYEARPAVGGRIIAFGGHLHPYGLSLRFEDATTGEVFWRGSGVTAADGSRIDVSRKILHWSRGIEIDASRTYRVTAVYYNPTPETIVDGGMGTVAGVFIPSESWPEVDRGDPLYLFDLARESGDQIQVNEHSHHGEHH